jgi:hypothetical protein
MLNYPGTNVLLREIEWRISIDLHPQMYSRTEQMNASMEEYLWVFVNHDQHGWVIWLPMSEFTAHNETFVIKKYTPLLGTNGTGHAMEEQDH